MVNRLPDADEADVLDPGADEADALQTADALEAADVSVPRTRYRILRSTAALPALFTLANGLFGFAAIHYATKDGFGQAALGNLACACWMVFAAMICDMLDGRVARMTRRTTDFGSQLDSLCDAVSFGVAPAVIMVQTFAAVKGGSVERVASFLPQMPFAERLVLCIGGLYVACAILRLARFNVETEADESAHMEFRGLPSPAAAGAVIALVLLFDHLTHFDRGLRSSSWALVIVCGVLPLVTLAAALLMVSPVRYPHLVNQYVRGRRSFGYLVRLVLVIIAAFVEFFLAGAAFMVIYISMGPIRWLLAQRRRRLLAARAAASRN